VSAADDEGQREIEWQLSATDLGLVRKWLSDHGSVHGLTIESRPNHTINDTYLDTEDWRLRRAGFALRLRDVPGGAEATLKDITPASDGVRIRREFNEPLPSAEFEALAVGSGPVSSRVHAVAGAEPLKALFRVRTQRECFVALEHEDPGRWIAGRVSCRPASAAPAHLSVVKLRRSQPNRSKAWSVNCAANARSCRRRTASTRWD
jgi:hypothetical protein